MVLWPTVMISLGDLGLVHSFSYFTARNRTSPRPMLRLARRAATLQSLYLVPATLLVAWIGLTLADAEPVGAGLVLAAVFVPAALISRYVAAVFQGELRMPAFYTVRLSMHVVIAVALLVVLALDAMSVWNVVLAYLAGLGFMIVVTFGLAHRRAERLPREDDPPLPFTRREFLGFGLRALPGTLYPVEGLFLDQLVIGIFLGPHELGLYVAALAFTTLPRLAAYAVGLVALPMVARAPTERKAGMTTQLVVLTVLVLTPLAAILAVAMPWLLPLVFGHDFDNAIGPARFLVMGSLFFGVRQVLGQCIRGAGAPGLVSVVEMGSWPFIIVAAASAPVVGLEGITILLLGMQALTLAALVVTRRRSAGGGSSGGRPEIAL